MTLTKTTFELDAALLAQLKSTAARVGKSLRDLLTEGARTVLEKHQHLEDREVLQRRAKEAQRRFIGSFSSSPNSSSSIDRVVYGVGERPVEYSAGELDRALEQRVRLAVEAVRQDFEVTRERARRIEAKALRKLRKR